VDQEAAVFPAAAVQREILELPELPECLDLAVRLV